MLREHPIDGWVRLSYEREPDFFASASVEGDSHYAFIAEDPAGVGVNAVFSYSVRERYVGGTRRRVSYLGQLRVREGYAGKGLLTRDGFDLCRKALQDPGVVPYFLTTIISDNSRAVRMLTSGRRGMPVYKPLGNIGILACRSRQGSSSNGLPVSSVSDTDMIAVADYLEREAPRYDFTPVWTVESLRSPKRCPGLSSNDFLVVRDGKRIIGCAAVWDQRSVKQNVVRGYGLPVGWIRPALNLLSPVTGWPRLPKTGKMLNTAFLSHFHIEEGREDAALAIMNSALSMARKRGLEALVTGFDVRDPRYVLLKRRFRPVTYLSKVYAAYWPFGEAAAQSLGQRLMAPEIAVL